MAPARKSGERFEQLDLLRIVAAMLVLLNHFGLYGTESVGFAQPGETLAYPALNVFVGIGAVGLPAFFVISGVVISMTAERFMDRGDAKGFAIARATRLLPVLWSSAFVGGITLLATGSDPVSVANMLLRTLLLSPAGPYVDGVVWSLVVEVIFYGVIGLVIALRSRLAMSRLPYLLGGASASFLCIRLLACVFGWSEVDRALERYVFRLLLLEHGVYFVLGMTVWSMRRQAVRPSNVAFASLMFGACLVQLHLAHRPDLGVVLWTMGLFGGFVVLIRAALAPSNARLQVPATAYLGRLSYPLYLNHLTLGSALTAGISAQGAGSIATFAATMTGIISICCAMLWIESSVQRWARQRFSSGPRKFAA